MYVNLINFGNTPANALPIYNNDPLTYCIGNNLSQRFNHGSNSDLYGQNCEPCQVFMSQRCAKKWDNVCEYAASHKANEEYATRASTSFAGNHQVIGLSPGEIFLRNTAMEKYRTAMLNCQLKTVPFNPINPSSPLISYYVGQNCIPIYEVNPMTINNDPVMNRILDKPWIATQMLVNIKNTMKRKGTFHLLKGTRLGNFYGV